MFKILWLPPSGNYEVGFGRCKTKGIEFRFKNRFFIFYWVPYSPFYIDKNGEAQISRKYSFITFKINQHKKGLVKLNESPIKPALPKETAIPAQLKREGATEVKVIQTRKERGEDAEKVPQE